MKKQSIRKWTARLAVLLAAAFMLMGCTKGNGTADSRTGDTTATQTKAVEEKQNLPYCELTFYHSAPKLPDEKIVMDELSKYVLEKLNCKLNVIIPDNWNKIPPIIQSGQDWDIVFTTTWLANNYSQYSKMGAYREVNDLLDQYGPKLKEAIPEVYWKGSKINGKNYLVPSVQPLGNAHGIYYNADMAKEAGIDMSGLEGKGPEIVGILYDKLMEFKKKMPDVLPVMALGADRLYNWDLIAGDWGLPIYMNTPGYHFYKAVPDETVYVSTFQPEFLETMKLYRKYWENGLVPKDPSQPLTASGDAFQQKKFFLSYILGGDETWRQTKSKDMGFEVGYAEVARPVQTTLDTQQGFAINAKSKNPERALMFLEMLNTDLYVGTLVRSGIEGIHYKAVGADRIDKTAVEGYNPEKPRYGYGSGWEWGNIFNQKWDISWPENVVELKKAQSTRGVESSAMGFVFDPDPVQNEIAAVKNVMNEYYTPITQGVIDPVTNIPKMNEKLKATGIEKIVQECQKQFDQWKATK